MSHRAASPRGFRPVDVLQSVLTLHRPDVTATAGLTGGAVGMGLLLALGLGGGVFLVTAKPVFALGAAAAGLLLGSQLHSETATA